MSAATITLNRRNEWTGTLGVGAHLTIVHAPSEEFERMTARAALDFVIDNFGAEEAERMTLAEMLECLVELT